MAKGYSIKAKGNAEAEIFLYGDVGGGGWFSDGVTAKQFADDLKAAGKVDTIHLRINSYGGDVFDGLAIYRQLVDHKAKVIAHVDGIAASIASIIAMSADEIEISESGFLMIHDAWGVAIGTADDMRTTAGLLDVTTASLTEVYVSRTRNSTERVREWMVAETWFTGAEAVEHGFADRMAANMRVAAKFDPSRHKFRHAPAALSDAPGAVTPNRDAAMLRIAAQKFKMGKRAA